MKLIEIETFEDQRNLNKFLDYLPDININTSYWPGIFYKDSELYFLSNNKPVKFAYTLDFYGPGKTDTHKCAEGRTRNNFYAVFAYEQTKCDKILRAICMKKEIKYNFNDDKVYIDDVRVVDYNFEVFEKMDYKSAVNHCKTNNKYLLELNNEEDERMFLDFIRKQQPNYSVLNSYWIGLNYKSKSLKSNKYDNIVSYGKWLSNPFIDGEEDYCVHGVFYETPFVMGSDKCDEKKHVVCMSKWEHVTIEAPAYNFIDIPSQI